MDVLEEGEEELDKAREQLYKDIGYVENEELKYPKEVGQATVDFGVFFFGICNLGKVSPFKHLNLGQLGFLAWTSIWNCRILRVG